MGGTKRIFIAVLVLVVALAFGATPAFAKYAGFSSTMQYVDWATASSLASMNADAADMDGGPHADYATTTIKCAVCHSVHRGSSKLLNSGVACAYCHTATYYGGGSFAYPALISWKVSGGAGPHSSCGAEYCHGGPHGVGASKYKGQAALLFQDSQVDAKLETIASANGVAYSTFNTRNQTQRALGTAAVCGRPGCHNNSMFGVVTAGATMTVDGTFTPSGAVNPAVTGHRVIANATTSWNANGTDFPTTKTGLQIAWRSVTYCNSCHDLTDDNNDGKRAFPHAINDVVSVLQGKNAGSRTAVWLTAGPNAVTQSMAVSGYNQYTIAGTGGLGLSSGNAPAGSTIIDGMCLKCHRSATSGIGIDF